ncbi:hypothetical protein HK105_203384 [Polyrhizophydium stewartii]|uniref:Uncharacterized protein n=1 Tax=Polyrhizophydium stewartii TaxID=2732419 RepID=A0ABR4NBU3_9FUNG
MTARVNALEIFASDAEDYLLSITSEIGLISRAVNESAASTLQRQRKAQPPALPRLHAPRPLAPSPLLKDPSQGDEVRDEDFEDIPDAADALAADAPDPLDGSTLRSPVSAADTRSLSRSRSPGSVRRRRSARAPSRSSLQTASRMRQLLSQQQELHETATARRSKRPSVRPDAKSAGARDLESIDDKAFRDLLNICQRYSVLVEDMGLSPGAAPQPHASEQQLGRQPEKQSAQDGDAAPQHRQKRAAKANSFRRSLISLARAPAAADPDTGLQAGDEAKRTVEDDMKDIAALAAEYSKVAETGGTLTRGHIEMFHRARRNINGLTLTLDRLERLWKMAAEDDPTIINLDDDPADKPALAPKPTHVSPPQSEAGSGSTEGSLPRSVAASSLGRSQAAAAAAPMLPQQVGQEQQHMHSAAAAEAEAMREAVAYARAPQPYPGMSPTGVAPGSGQIPPLPPMPLIPPMRQLSPMQHMPPMPPLHPRMPGTFVDPSLWYSPYMHPSEMAYAHLMPEYGGYMSEHHINAAQHMQQQHLYHQHLLMQQHQQQQLLQQQQQQILHYQQQLQVRMQVPPPAHPATHYQNHQGNGVVHSAQQQAAIAQQHAAASANRRSPSVASQNSHRSHASKQSRATQSSSAAQQHAHADQGQRDPSSPTTDAALHHAEYVLQQVNATHERDGQSPEPQLSRAPSVRSVARSQASEPSGPRQPPRAVTPVPAPVVPGIVAVIPVKPQVPASRPAVAAGAPIRTPNAVAQRKAKHKPDGLGELITNYSEAVSRLEAPQLVEQRAPLRRANESDDVRNADGAAGGPARNNDDDDDEIREIDKPPTPRQGRRESRHLADDDPLKVYERPTTAAQQVAKAKPAQKFRLSRIVKAVSLATKRSFTKDKSAAEASANGASSEASSGGKQGQDKKRKSDLQRAPSLDTLGCARQQQQMRDFEEIDMLLDRLGRLDKPDDQAYVRGPRRAPMRLSSIEEEHGAGSGSAAGVPGHPRAGAAASNASAPSSQAGSPVLSPAASPARSAPASAAGSPRTQHRASTYSTLPARRPATQRSLRASSDAAADDTPFDEIERALDRMGRMGRIANQSYVRIPGSGSTMEASTLYEASSTRSSSLHQRSHTDERTDGSTLADFQRGSMMSFTSSGAPPLIAASSGSGVGSAGAHYHVFQQPHRHSAQGMSGVQSMSPQRHQQQQQHGFHSPRSAQLQHTQQQHPLSPRHAPTLSPRQASTQSLPQAEPQQPRQELLTSTLHRRANSATSATESNSTIRRRQQSADAIHDAESELTIQRPPRLQMDGAVASSDDASEATQSAETSGAASATAADAAAGAEVAMIESPGLSALTPSGSFPPLPRPETFLEQQRQRTHMPLKQPGHPGHDSWYSIIDLDEPLLAVAMSGIGDVSFSGGTLRRGAANGAGAAAGAGGAAGASAAAGAVDPVAASAAEPTARPSLTVKTEGVATKAAKLSPAPGSGHVLRTTPQPAVVRIASFTSREVAIVTLDGKPSEPRDASHSADGRPQAEGVVPSALARRTVHGMDDDDDDDDDDDFANTSYWQQNSTLERRPGGAFAAGLSMPIPLPPPVARIAAGGGGSVGGSVGGGLGGGGGSGFSVLGEIGAGDEEAVLAADEYPRHQRVHTAGDESSEWTASAVGSARLLAAQPLALDIAASPAPSSAGSSTRRGSAAASSMLGRRPSTLRFSSTSSLASAVRW